jgi:glycosyltransferase involved in cell wall biosynthesis
VKAPEIWAGMKLNVRIIRLLKCAQIKIFIDTPRIVTVQSRFVAEQMYRILGRENTHIIPCPVDKPSGDYSLHPHVGVRPLQKTPKLLCLSSFATHKNVKILADVAEKLLSRNINVEIILTLDNQDKEVKSFLNKIRKSGLSGVLKNIGVLTPNEVEFWINSCDAVLLPTKLETFGLPYIEALCRGRPVLTSDLAFAREVCQTGTIFFDPDNPDDISEKINKFIVNGGAIIENKIVESIMEQCGPEKVYTRILEL